MPVSGLTSDYLLRLCKICLSTPPEILACDSFYSKSYLPENSSYIVNLQKSNLPEVTGFLFWLKRIPFCTLIAWAYL